MVGAVVVSSPSARWTGLLTVMSRTIVMASLWIMLAALIAVYFISERVSAPLREMRHAVKDFAGGQFERRVVVQGNDEIAELGMAFNQMAQSLENLDKTRSSFMANVSHDLRSPMTTIAGFIDAIRDGIIPPEKHDYYLGIISGEIHRLSRLVSSLLDVTRIEAGERKFVMAPFDICEMGRQILISFEQQIEAKQLAVEFLCDEDSMTALADHDAIYQIFYNICDNAVKFSRDDGVLRVGIQRVESEKKNKLQVSVYNQGQGIAAEDIPMVFERFYKGDKSRGLDRSGTGLGMYIAKTIISAHGEDIWVTSAEGKDCQFAFTLKEAPTGDKR
jgi:signal transduction histidine kinase